jgi:FkbM family methyltransferase
VLRWRDPVIETTVFGVPLLLPLSHELPRHLRNHPEYSSSLARLAAALELDEPEACVIDIGANVGDSAALIRSTSTLPVLCVEGDPVFTPLLAHNLRRIADCEFEPSYVATHDRAAHRDRRDGGEAPPLMTIDRHDGTARLLPTTASPEPAPDRLTIEPLAAILKRRPRFRRPGLVKIDTDGNDVAILRAAAALLAEVQPVLYFELDPVLTLAATGYDGSDVFELLGGLGYDDVVVYLNTGPLLLASTVDNPALGDLVRSLGRPGGIEYVDVAAFPTSRRSLAAAFVDAERARAPHR